jgi:pilus assembly protein CpaE
MAILFEPSGADGELMSLAIGPSVVVVDGPVALRQAVTDHPDDDLVIVGAAIDLELVLHFASTMRVTRPSLGVVLLRRRLDTSLLTQALRHGVREVVLADDLPALREACTRSMELSRQVRGTSAAAPALTATAQGRVVTVFSAKGGCGKTTTSTNVAAALAAGGARRVCLVDLDLAFGDVAITMQLFPVRTIADAVNLGKLDATAVQDLLTSHSPGLDALVAPVEPGAAERIPAALVSDLLTVLQSMYDYVVVDTPPAFTDHVLAAFDLSDDLVLLATLDIPALKNLKLTLETLDMLGYQRDRWHVLLNRADSKVGLSVSDVEKTLKCKIAAEVPSSRAVPACINRGVPIVLDQPGHSVSQAFRKFAEASLVRRTAAASTPAQRGDRRRLSLLRRGGESG